MHCKLRAGLAVKIFRMPTRSATAITVKLAPLSQALAAVLLLACLFVFAPSCSAYSELTHEAIVDAAWDVAIRPLLLQRFPNATGPELRTAHAYAYGGSVIQDMGYYPFGSKLFTNLTHYVRSADFVNALLRDSQNLNDYAFALGALAHYAADNDGHNLAVNVSVPMLYPKMRKKYGDWVVYDQGPADHLRTEFGFDVLQIARSRYAPGDYQDHIGFQVAKALLEKAFQETYGLKLDSVFTNLNLAISTYRSGVSAVIPNMTKVAWQIKKDEIQKEIPGETREKYLYHLSRASYNQHWGKEYKKPGIGTRILAFLIRIVPKIGPFRALAFRTPTPKTEQFFMASFNSSLRDYDKDIHNEATNGNPGITNDNLDMGRVAGPGEYPLADKTYAELLHQLVRSHFAQVTPGLRDDVLIFYRDPNARNTMKKKKKEWAKITAEVAELKAFSPTVPAVSSN
ncbi:MAG: zinc dependent phospholipase C family protein [Candidatus Acidiferrales bacterium]